MSPAIYCPEDSPSRRSFYWFQKRGDNSDSTGKTSDPPAAAPTTTTTTTTDKLTHPQKSPEESVRVGGSVLIGTGTGNLETGRNSCENNKSTSTTTGLTGENYRALVAGGNNVLGRQSVVVVRVGEEDEDNLGNNGTTNRSVSVNSNSVNSGKEWNFIIKYMTAFTAAATAETVTYPLDLTKTRMQIQGEMLAGAALLKRSGGVGPINSAAGASSTRIGNGSNHNIGMLRTAIGICRDEGVLNLWKGILPALYRHVIYSGIRMALYEKLRDDVMGKDANGVFPVWKAAIAGLIVGGFAQFTASPMDLVKVQLQMEGRRKVEGMAPRVRNTQQALALIYKQGGVKGLWKGWVPNVQRGALVNLGDLTTYDSAKRFLITNCGFDDSVSVHVLSSLMAGFTAALMGTPADVIKTRVMNQPTNEHGQGIYYKSSIDCLRKTVGNEGIGALYKGFLPIWMRLGPWSLTFWVTFEWIRTFIGVGGF